mgnify:FL=1
MAYNILVWKDHAVAPANTYTVTENDDGTITLTPAGEIIQQGTNMSAVNFNNMETGIFAANMGAMEALQLLRLVKDKTDSLEGIILEDTLTNSQKYPFNNSTKTLALGNANVRNNKDYTVIVEAEAEDGFVGDIVVTDKMLNGFKLAYTGSASSVNVKCYVQGGK